MTAQPTQPEDKPADQPDQPADRPRLPWAGITDAERLGWQTRSAYLLLDLLHRSRREHLPPVAWTVGPAGATLTLRCATRADWQTWVRALHTLDIWEERTGHGFSHLHAVGPVQAADGADVTVAVIADLDLTVPAENAPAPPRPRHPGNRT